MKRLVLIDGYSLLHRAYFALPKNITTSKGDIVNAVYGFTRMLLKVIKDLKPNYIALAYDVKGPTFRDEIYEFYKEGRPEMEKELERQLPLVDEVVEAFNISIFSKVGYEADDVIATLVDKLKTKGEIIVVTGDIDLFQIIDKNVKVYAPLKGLSDPILYGEGEVKERFGFDPHKILDYKALQGDASDNIPGVKGIGEKTATELLKKYKNIEDIYKNISQVDKRLVILLREGKNTVELSRRLVELKRDVPLEVDINNLKLKLDKQKLLKFFKKLEFKSLIKKLEEEGGEAKNRGQMRLI